MIPFVAAARVHLTLADRSILSQDRKAESTAAVLVRTNGPAPSLDRQLVELIGRKGGAVTPRDLMRSSRMFTTSPEAEAAPLWESLNELEFYYAGKASVMRGASELLQK